MKISIGCRLRGTPWGGVNSAMLALADELSARGHQVCFDLDPPDLDVILMVEPSSQSESASFTHVEILRYLLFTNHRSIVVHRINNSSEARDDPGREFNRFRIQANREVADHTVFISRWLYDRYCESGFASPPWSIVLNGGDTRLWHPGTSRKRGRKLRLVTHHWSANRKKGFDIYERLDEMLGAADWADRVAFTYVGRLPEGFRFRHSRYVEPLAGEALGEELRQHDVYVTAAMNEAAGMHHIEGALCGLPLLYRVSGALPEYCAGYGVGFTPDSFDVKLAQMIDTHEPLLPKMMDYPHTARRMCDDYLRLFEGLMDQRQEILKRRRRWRLLRHWLRHAVAGARRRFFSRVRSDVACGEPMERHRA